MKKTMILIACILFISCKSANIQSVNDIKAIKKSQTITVKDYRILEEAVRKESNAKELRLESLKALYENKYSKIDILLEDLVKADDGLKKEAIVLILKKNDFRYNPEIKREVLDFLIREKKYSYFIKRYNYEEISFSMIDVEKMIHDNLSEEQLQKIAYIVSKKNDYKSFKILIEFDEENSLKYFIKSKWDWVEKYIVDNKRFLNFDKNILIDNYSHLNTMIDNILEAGNSEEKMKAAEIKVKADKTNIKRYLLDSNYYLQKEAIDIFGRENSREYLRTGSLKINDEVLRALSILKDEQAYDIIKDKFKENSDANYLLMLYLYGSQKTYNDVKNGYLLLNSNEKITLIDMMNSYNLVERDHFYYAVLSYEKDFEIRKKLFDGIADNDEKMFIKLTIESLEKEIDSDEKAYLLDTVGEISGEETKDQILKITEAKYFKNMVEEERSILSLSGKIKFWEEYIKGYPESSYIEFINEKLLSYHDKIENIKKELFDKQNNRVHMVDRDIEKYDRHIENETNMERKSILIAKRKDLKEKREKLLSEDFENRKSRLEEYQNEYIEVSDLVNSMSHQIYYMKQDPDIKEKRIIAMNRELDEVILKKSEVLEKIYFLYGEYLDSDINLIEELLSEDTLRDLRGMR